MGKAYNTIIVGLPCAGSPAAMLMARKGYRVVPGDRATFPSGSRKAMDAFVRMNAGTISPAEFFSPENVGTIMAAATAAELTTATAN